jgi:hypothetical protein
MRSAYPTIGAARFTLRRRAVDDAVVRDDRRSAERAQAPAGKHLKTRSPLTAALRSSSGPAGHEHAQRSSRADPGSSPVLPHCMEGEA